MAEFFDRLLGDAHDVDMDDQAPAGPVHGTPTVSWPQTLGTSIDSAARDVGKTSRAARFDNPFTADGR